MKIAVIMSKKYAIGKATQQKVEWAISVKNFSVNGQSYSDV